MRKQRQESRALAHHVSTSLTPPCDQWVGLDPLQSLLWSLLRVTEFGEELRPCLSQGSLQVLHRDAPTALRGSASKATLGWWTCLSVQLHWMLHAYRALQGPELLLRVLSRRSTQ